jgi:hypothetical protein
VDGRGKRNGLVNYGENERKEGKKEGRKEGKEDKKEGKLGGEKKERNTEGRGEVIPSDAVTVVLEELVTFRWRRAEW